MKLIDPILDIAYNFEIPYGHKVIMIETFRYRSIN